MTKKQILNRIVFSSLIAVIAVTMLLQGFTFSRIRGNYEVGVKDETSVGRKEVVPIAQPEVEEDPFPQEEWERLVSKTVRDGLAKFEKDLDKALAGLNQALNTEFAELRQRVSRRGNHFAERQLTRRTIAELGRRMAMDKVGNGNRFDTWMEENLFRDLHPVFQRYSENTSLAVAKFERAVQVAMDDFDRYVYQSLQEEVRRFPSSPTAAHLQAEITRQMRTGVRAGNLQLAVATITLPLDGLAMAMVFPAVRSAITATLSRSLAGLVAKIAGTTTGATASSWAIPVGVGVAVVGTAWSGYDIYKLRDRTQKNFRHQLQRVLASQALILNQQVRRPTRAYVNELKKAYREAAPRITADLQSKSG